MSSKRITASGAVLAAAVVTGGWFGAEAIALQDGPVATAPRPGERVPVRVAPPTAIGPVELRAKPVTPENPIPRRTYAVPVEVQPPPTSLTPLALTLRITVDESGRVAEARMVGVRVAPPGRTGGPLSLSGNVVTREATGTDQLATVAAAAIAAVKQWQYDPPFEGPLAFDVVVPIGPEGAQAADALRAMPLPTGRGGVGGGAPGLAVGPFPPPPVTGTPVRVGSVRGQPAKTRHVDPEYPEIAKAARVQGLVIVEIGIDVNGRVQEARVLRSIPLLDQAALDAVRQWEFMPLRLNGELVPVIMTTTVQFSLPPKP